MAREAISKRMHEEFVRWLEHKGLNPNDVLQNYVIHSEGGYTNITLTLFANDFPIPAGAFQTPQDLRLKSDHSRCGPECTIEPDHAFTE